MEKYEKISKRSTDLYETSLRRDSTNTSHFVRRIKQRRSVTNKQFNRRLKSAEKYCEIITWLVAFVWYISLKGGRV